MGTRAQRTARGGEKFLAALAAGTGYGKEGIDHARLATGQSLCLVIRYLSLLSPLRGLYDAISG
jgi:hypothetical protein